MTRPRLTVRLRLTVLYAALLVLTTVVLLGLSWWLMRHHLQRTLPPPLADDISGRLLAQYAIATLGTALLAGGIGWAAAGRVLSPLRRMTATARRVSEHHLDERIGLAGPPDELQALGETLDEMLDRLQGAVDAQRRFVANASHELHSPLTVIRTECEVTLSDPDATNADLRRMGEVVLEAADRTEGLLDGLLVLALSQRGLQRDEPVDLAVLARKAAAHVAAEAAEIHVRVRVEAEPAPVRGDPMLLERMVANLAENAVRHNEPGGWVTIQTGSDGGEAVLRVENGGRPIPPDAVERLADPFQRLARSAERRGSGLGLSIVRSVAEAHDGRLALAAGTEGGLCAEVALRRSAGVLMPA